MYTSLHAGQGPAILNIGKTITDSTDSRGLQLTHWEASERGSSQAYLGVTSGHCGVYNSTTASMAASEPEDVYCTVCQHHKYRSDAHGGQLTCLQ